MRIKKLPSFLSSRIRLQQSFFFFGKLGSDFTEPESAAPLKCRKSKLNVDEQKELSITYPYYIHLVKQEVPTDRLLQTISIPVDCALRCPSSACKVTLFFNSASFLLYWREAEISHQFVVTDCENVTPFLFAASSTLLVVYYEMTNSLMQLHVCYKAQQVHASEDFLERANSCQQYAKISDFIMLLQPEMALSLRHGKAFVFDRHCESQPEFIQLIKNLYEFAQNQHMSDEELWKNRKLDLSTVVTSLRPYQVDVVKWMCYRESNLLLMDTVELLNLMYVPIDLPQSQNKLYFAVHSGMFTDRLPYIKPPSLGGILADEMGLGKTLEVISLVLAHPWLDWHQLGGSLYDLDGRAVAHSSENVSVAARAQQVLCCCGGEAVETQSCELVQCSRCHGPAQHAVCVQFENAEEFMRHLPNRHTYICPECWSQIRIHSKATLIVAPDHIWQQWKEELQAHVTQGSMTVLLYAGMEAPVSRVEVGIGCTAGTTSRRISRGQTTSVNPFSPRTLVKARGKCDDGSADALLLPGFVQPGQLASADVVLTAFSVVQRELGWAEVTAERRAGLGQRPQLRLAQRYLCRPSPLTCVRWWRLCLDEAQMVERVTSKTARMLFQIESVHRWCITGTPAEKSIDDLFGLFVFLRFEPFSIPLYWHSLLYQPFLSATTDSWSGDTVSMAKAIHKTEHGVESQVSSAPNMSAIGDTLLAKTLAKMLWRNTKQLVGDQLNLPPIAEQIHWITFTPVERYIHDRVLAQSADALNRLLGKFSPDQPLANLSGTTHWRLIYLITRLRQVCTHASLVVASSGVDVSTSADRQGRCRYGGGSRRRHPNHLSGDGDSDGGDDEEIVGRSAGKDYGVPSVSAARSHRHLGTGCFTMTEVLRKVVDETRRECESLLRSWIFSKNGAASCYIIKQKYIDAADSYRDVLRIAASLESRYGVLADCSQHLHAITNLHWLIEAHHVPFSEENDPFGPLSVLRNPPNSVQPTESQGDKVLDPRVDRDLVAKAERLRLSYIQRHSHLLAKVHDSLDPIVVELNAELCCPSVGVVDQSIEPERAWLDWLHEAIDWLATCGVDGTSLVSMLMASFQGRPLGKGGRYRTTLLHLGDSGANSFKTRLLYELSDVFDSRRQLHRAMQPLTTTWTSFQSGMEVDRNVLEPFYACCARADEPEAEDETESSMAISGKKKKKKVGSELQSQDTSPLVERTRKVKGGQLRCAYCTAVKALRRYQCALNHEKPTRLNSNNKHSASGLNASRIDELQLEEQRSTVVDQELTANGLILGNPLVISLTIVCHQVLRCLGQLHHDESSGIPVPLWRRRARRLDQIIRLMGKEILLMSRTQSLTREWWNIHDDTEQFVVRLQATCPTDNAFIHLEEVDLQLQSYIVEADVTWPELQSRLGHFSFLRNAHLTTTASGANTGASQHRLECPTCLQVHSSANPTFALLPGCWHTLCLPCHDRISTSGQVCQRRCPICRTPLVTATSAHHAHRRRPLTLIHYAGEETGDSAVSKEEYADVDEQDLFVVGDHSSKIQAVIRCLKQIKRGDPDAKAIVFSSWLSVLVTLAGALEQNDLVYTTFLRARDACQPGRLTGFQFPGSATWILLMPVQLGANGLNLTSANHLLLVDPVLSHGREAQAIARMHRIGQSRPSVVHRFLVKDSIEAALHTAHSRSGLSPTGYCMIGGGARRTSSTSLGVAGPGEDRAQLMQMTVGQLAELLRVETDCFSSEATATGQYTLTE